MACWGWNQWGQADAPRGPFSRVDAAAWHACGLRPDGNIECWGDNRNGETEAPKGTFVDLVVGRNFGCAMRSNGTAECWGNGGRGRFAPDHDEEPVLEPAAGSLAQVVVGQRHACWLDSDGPMTCVGSVGHKPPSGQFETLAIGDTFTCGLRVTGILSCTGHLEEAIRNAGEHRYRSVSAEGHLLCALGFDQEVDCWTDGEGGSRIAVPAGQFFFVTVGSRSACGIRADGSVECWEAANSGDELPSVQSASRAVRDGAHRTGRTHGVRHSPESDHRMLGHRPL